MQVKSFKHRFHPTTWVKIENRAKREGRTPEEVAAFILAERVGLIPRGAKANPH